MRTGFVFWGWQSPKGWPLQLLDQFVNLYQVCLRRFDKEDFNLVAGNSRLFQPQVSKFSTLPKLQSTLYFGLHNATMVLFRSLSVETQCTV